MDVKIILNNRKQETIEVSHDGYHASVPYGRSVGRHEMKKVDAQLAARNVKILWEMVNGLPNEKAEEILRKNVKEMGANSTLAISYLLYKLAKQKVSENTFPYPLGNVAGGWDKKQIQEFLVIPVSAKSMSEAVQINRDVWKLVGEELGIKKNDENGWISKYDDMETLDKVVDIAENAGCRVGLDMAASNLWNGKEYVYDNLQKKYSPEKQYVFVRDIIETYDLMYVEDPFHENEEELFSDLTMEVGNRCIINGDDLYATNPARFTNGIDLELTNGILVKPDQIGTLSSAQEIINMAHKACKVPVPSHRSGDTEETILADLSVNWLAPLVKFGVMGLEREAKLNRLIELWNNARSPKMNKIKF